MIFSLQALLRAEAAAIGLANESVPAAELLAASKRWWPTSRATARQTIRATKVSLNYDSDSLYPSWQHGMELLANIWGTEESLEGMNAFLEKRPPTSTSSASGTRPTRHLHGQLQRRPQPERHVQRPPGVMTACMRRGASPVSGSIDLTRVLAGPLVAMWLGDMGADVIKIERPGGRRHPGLGSPVRSARESAYFLGVNRNKRSLTLDSDRRRDETSCAS